ncbi:mammalian cell entry protein [Mycobacterium saskatchewanense]|uniref:Mammalian cell entry protein n=1 Tax=Mycobacterium saskatchewanense TaxID=220927 RepID=A0AAJ3TWE2_9MYCO|nr:mammalian cell entry protein [Mycobacterium saskatchewanense]
MFLGLVTLTALGALSGWLALHAYQGRQVQQQRQLYLQVGRQAAVNLTSINYAEVDTDVQRILDSATGAFRDDFAQRSKAFIDVVKRAQSRSEGTITAAGLESVDGDRAQVVVAVMVKTTMPAAADDQARGWRMRIGVQKEGKVVKVSSVRFVE